MAIASACHYISKYGAQLPFLLKYYAAGIIKTSVAILKVLGECYNHFYEEYSAVCIM